jgi:hypothetical protein
MKNLNLQSKIKLGVGWVVSLFYRYKIVLDPGSFSLVVATECSNRKDRDTFTSVPIQSGSDPSESWNSWTWIPYLV